MNSICKERVKRHFSRAVASYDEVTAVQRRMAHTLVEKLIPLGPFSRILEIGCGTGYLTALLLDAFPEARVDAFDISEAMAEATRRRCPDPRLTVYTADGEAGVAPGTYDLIVSNAVFQWFEDPIATAVRWTGQLSGDGVLAVATFGDQTFRELHRSYAAAAKALGRSLPGPIGLRFSAMGDWKKGFEAAEIPVVTLWEAEHQTYHPTPREFLRSVKAMGASNAAKGGAGTLGKAWMQALLRCYEEGYTTPQGVVATYHEIGAIIRKKPL